MPRLGVIGWPVAHSRSPAMFQAAFAARGMRDWSYQRLPIPDELFEETVPALGASGFIGANVTIPYKSRALALADESSVQARAIGAANTLTFLPEGRIAAANTDAPGLLAAIGRPVKGMSALVLGAGGSARAAVWALLDDGAREVSVWNRKPQGAVSLASEMGARAVRSPVSAELLVNCTPVGMERTASVADALNQLTLTADQVGSYDYVVDLVYSDVPTPLLVAAQTAGSRVVGGLEILLAQGALSFQLWTGQPAPIEQMRSGAGLCAH